VDGVRFDRLVRMVSRVTTRRRSMLALLAGGAIPDLGAAKKHKRRKEKIKRNSFGCVDVGKFCKNDDQCCSGVCAGKKGKKKCRAHDTGGCTAEQDACIDPASATCTTSAGYPSGLCTRTTGKASYCTDILFACVECTKDADCQQYCGPRAACVVCASCAPGTTLCTGAEGSCSLAGMPRMEGLSAPSV
jgi:hypothetical protein